MDDIARILTSTDLVFETLDPTVPLPSRMIVNWKDPESAARALGLSMRDTERFIVWLEQLKLNP